MTRIHIMVLSLILGLGVISSDGRAFATVLDDPRIAFLKEPLPEVICDGRGRKMALNFSIRFFHAKIKILGPWKRVSPKSFSRKAQVQVLEVLRGTAPAQTFSLHYVVLNPQQWEHPRYSEGRIHYILGRKTESKTTLFGLKSSAIHSTRAQSCVKEKTWFSEWLDEWFPRPN